jgi:hypothetical protein
MTTPLPQEVESKLAEWHSTHSLSLEQKGLIHIQKYMSEEVKENEILFGFWVLMPL